MLSEQECQSILDEMIERFAENTVQIPGKLSFRDRILMRRKLVFNLDPTWSLKEPLKDFPRFQSDLPRKVWTELRARMCENHFVIRVNPLKQVATQRVNANELEAVWNTGIGLVEERIGYRLQESIADGQIIDGISVLHWRKMEEIYPDYPEPELAEEVPETERERYSKRRRNGYYEERPEAVKERRQLQRAKAGFPWHVEVMDATNVMWLDSECEEATVVATVREIPYLRYLRELQDKSGINITLDPVNNKVMLVAERSVIPEWTEVSQSSRMTVAQVWTKTHFYELASPSTGGGLVRKQAWQLVKSGEHPYEMPPFAIIPAVRARNAPGAIGYQSALEGMLNLKEGYDRSVTLMLGLEEQSVIKKFWFEKAAGGAEPPLSEDGETTIELSGDSALAGQLPEGYRLKATEHEVTPGFVQAVGFQRQEFLDAKPSTGKAEFSASTQPWAFRLALQMENVEPKTLIDNALAGIRKMVRNCTMVMSKSEEEGGFGEPINVFAYITKDGVDERRVVGVDPRQIESLDVDVDINTTSGAERISIVEHGRSLLNDPLVPMTTLQFLDEYMKVQNPEQRYAEWVAWKHFETEVLPKIMSQEIAKRLSSKFSLGPNGDTLGPDGMPVPPEAVLEANGMAPIMPPPMMPPQPMGGPPMGGPPMGMPMGPQPPGGAGGAVMPSLPGAQVPGAIPIPGLPG